MLVLSVQFSLMSGILSTSPPTYSPTLPPTHSPTTPLLPQGESGSESSGDESGSESGSEKGARSEVQPVSGEDEEQEDQEWARSEGVGGRSSKCWSSQKSLSRS